MGREVVKQFKLNRLEDATGISGEGIIAEGIQFSDGRCVLRWLTEITSIGIYDSIDDVEFIHGHDGKTVIEWEQ
ncbi:MAG TPA: hypothetical protein ENH85_12355 [Candidatus Scalindua sp.]|nr:hypothetical protein [Candidatus Scalindua sp.]